MALAIRNARRFVAPHERPPVAERSPTAARRPSSPAPAGWLGPRAASTALARRRAGPALRPSSPTTRREARALRALAAGRAPSTSIVGDIAALARPRSAARTATGGHVDVIHTAGVIHPRAIADVRRGQRRRHRATSLDAARDAGVRRVVHVSSNSPFGTNPHPTRHVPRRRAVPPVLRLRALEDAGRARACSTPSSAGSTP